MHKISVGRTLSWLTIHLEERKVKLISKPGYRRVVLKDNIKTKLMLCSHIVDCAITNTDKNQLQ
uniref:Uncharacterized protein n=1 Tax=Arion vulgaris TaxID=1028688 RepID=A0A0B7ABP1_9EUPU